jgi:hypothetical protein
VPHAAIFVREPETHPLGAFGAVSPLAGGEERAVSPPVKRETRAQRARGWFSVVHVLRFDLEFLLTGFADPVMFAVDERVVVDAFAVVFGAEIAFHTNAILP